MFKRVLVPLDGSQLAEAALPYAEELAGRLKSEVILLHVCTPSESQLQHMHESYMRDIAENVRRRAIEYLKGVEGQAIGVEWAMVTGEPVQGIIDYAESKDAGMIIMATHGRSGISRWAMGSVADKVVRGTTRPVALIRAKPNGPAVREIGMLQRVVVPLDGSEVGEAALPYVEELAATLGSEVVLLQVVSPISQAIGAEGYTYAPGIEEQLQTLKAIAAGYLEKVVARLQARGIRTRAEVRVGSAGDEIIALADEIKADAVAMSTHGRSGLGRWALGSVADKVLNRGGSPLILVRAPGAKAQ